jgi:exosome complex RNA-binding protein Rrp4
MGRKCINCGGDIVVGKVFHEIEDDVYEVDIKTECVYCEVLTRTKVEKRDLLDKLKQKRRRLIYLEERLNLRKLKNQIERYPNNFEDF